MAVAEPVALLDEIIEFLAHKPSLDEIVAFRPSEMLEERLEDLLDKNRLGTLNDSERAELDTFMRTNHFMSMLQMRIEQRLVGRESCPAASLLPDASIG
jgi:hypothetical protein